MGFSSWKISKKVDEKKTRDRIRIDEMKAVYMLSPEGDHICEMNYDGYGRFGGISIGEHMYNINLRSKEERKAMEENEYYAEENPEFMKNREQIGYAIMDNDGVYTDKDTGVKYSFHNYFPALGIKKFTGNYETKQEVYDKTPNELIDSGQWIETGLRDIFLQGAEYYPLKFSRDKCADYFDYKEAERDPRQGL